MYFQIFQRITIPTVQSNLSVQISFQSKHIVMSSMKTKNDINIKKALNLIKYHFELI